MTEQELALLVALKQVRQCIRLEKETTEVLETIDQIAEEAIATFSGGGIDG